MHRKPQLQEAARKLQEIINNRTSDVSYAQALDILSQLEGFEGYRQLRDFISKHSQNSAPAQVTSDMTNTEPQPKARPVLFVVEPESEFVRKEDGTLTVPQPGSVFPLHCVPSEARVPDSSHFGDVFKGLRPLPLDTSPEASNRTTVVDLVLTQDAHDGSEKRENRLVEIEINPRKASPDTRSD
jgi:hypothetical protein